MHPMALPISSRGCRCRQGVGAGDSCPGVNGTFVRSKIIPVDIECAVKDAQHIDGGCLSDQIGDPSTDEPPLP